MPTDPSLPVQWRLVINNGAASIPAYGLMRITGIDSDGNLTVAAVERDGDTNVIVNGAATIAPGEEGQAHQQWPAQVLWVASDKNLRPAPGDEWGLAINEFGLQRDRTGFIVLTSPVDSLVLVYPRTTSRLAIILTDSTDGGTGRLGGIEKQYDPKVRTYASVGPSVWLDPMQVGEVLSPACRYLGLPVGFNDSRPVYLCVGGFGEIVEQTLLTNVCPTDPTIPDGSIVDVKLASNTLTAAKIKDGEVLEAGDTLDGGTF